MCFTLTLKIGKLNGEEKHRVYHYYMIYEALGRTYCELTGRSACDMFGLSYIFKYTIVNSWVEILITY